jgi:hypothetical protein
LLVHVRCFSPSTPVSSTTKTGRHDIAEILLKVALNNKNQSINLMFQYECFTICVYTFSRHYYSCNTCSHDVKYKQSINKLKEEWYWHFVSLVFVGKRFVIFSGVRVARTLVFYVMYCLSFCPSSFGHCDFCPSIYGFWLHLLILSKFSY